MGLGAEQLRVCACVCVCVQNVAIIGGLLHYLASPTGTRHKNRYQRTMDAVRAEAAAQRQAAAAASLAGREQAQQQPLASQEEKKDQ